MSRQVAIAPGTPIDGKKSVTKAGTRVQLSAASAAVHQLDVTALSGNTGQIVVGGSTVVAASGATRSGTPLSAGDTFTVYDVDLSTVYLDSTVDGEGVSYSAVRL